MKIGEISNTSCLMETCELREHAGFMSGELWIQVNYMRAIGLGEIQASYEFMRAIGSSELWAQANYR